MTDFYAVFTTPDPETTPIFWGAFQNAPDANTAIDQFLADHPYWSREEFQVHNLPFGVML